MHSLARFYTERLMAERPRAEHLQDIIRLHSDPRVMLTLSADGKVFRDDVTEQMFSRMLEHWIHHDWGLWLWRDRTTGEFVGRCGLKHVQVDGEDEVEVGYAVLSPFWRRGFATEMARASIEAGFEQLGLPDIVSFTLPHNHGSRRVMEKLGLRYERDIVHAGLPHVLYRIRRDDYHAGHAAA